MNADGLIPKGEPLRELNGDVLIVFASETVDSIPEVGGFTEAAFNVAAEVEVPNPD